MIRQATIDDVPVIVQDLYDYVDTSEWKLLYMPNLTRPKLTRFVEHELLNPRSLLLVWEEEGKVTAFCGVHLGQFYAPPFVPTVCEWGWYGEPRNAVKLWITCCKWGKEHGAKLAGRAVIEPDSTDRRVHEHIIWKVL